MSCVNMVFAELGITSLAYTIFMCKNMHHSAAISKMCSAFIMHEYFPITHAYVSGTKLGCLWQHQIGKTR
jgi:hypothetical protein